MMKFGKKPDEGRQRLREVMRRRGAFLPHPLTALGIEDAALAARRCLECDSKALCDELLDAGRTDGYGAFCPNTDYVERLRQGSLRLRWRSPDAPR